MLESLNNISVKAYKECLEDMIEVSHAGNTIRRITALKDDMYTNNRIALNI